MFLSLIATRRQGHEKFRAVLNVQPALFSILPCLNPESFLAAEHLRAELSPASIVAQVNSDSLLVSMVCSLVQTGMRAGVASETMTTEFSKIAVV